MAPVAADSNIPWDHVATEQAMASFPLEPLAVEVPGTRKPGETGHYRNRMYRHGTELLSIYSDPIFPKTAYELFEHGVEVAPNGKCLGKRPWSNALQDYEPRYTWETYSEIAQRRTHVGSALIHLAETILDVDKVTGWAVGIWSINRPEWQVVSLATTAYSLLHVSLYDTLGPSAVEFCTNHSECRVIFASPAHIPELIRLTDKCPKLKVIVSMDRWEDIDAPNGGPSQGALPKGKVLKDWGASKGLTIMDIYEMEVLGQANPRAHIPPKPDDMASLCYTSGTTGNPKGGILTHKLLAICSIGHVHGRAFEPEDITISYLPLSHIYQRFTEDLCFYAGTGIGYSCGDNTRLLEDLQILKPTSMVAVPRVLNKLYQAIKSATLDAPGLKGALARRGFATKIANLRKDGTVTHAFWDRILMKKVAGAVGGNLRFIGTGSAAVSPAVLEFLSVAFSSFIQEGYGSTENGGTCTKNMHGDYTAGGLVGPPVPSVEIKLIDVADLGYRTSDKPYPRGEILCRGEGVIPGYYKDPEKTAESFDHEGFFKTGDIGLIDNLGRLKIVDRVKNLVKLSQGEYVAVEKVENVYSVPSLGAQIFVYADSLQSHLILFVVPDPIQLSAFVKQVLGQTIDPTDIEGLQKATEDPRVAEAALKLYNQEAKAQKLNGYETAKQLTFRMTPFSVEEDTLTPTMKIKRNIANKLLKPRADALYAEFDGANAGRGGFKGAKL